MAPRTTWKGHLRLSLVSCPVKLYNAISRSERVSFNLLHKDTHNRIQMHPHDPELGQVDRADLVKGYEYEKDQYVVLTDEDFDKVQIESSRAIVIEKFVDEQEVDPLYFESPYYMAPDGAVAEETFRVLHEAMRSQKKVALSRVVLSNRERLIAISVRDKGFTVMTLRAANEVRDGKAVFEEIDGPDPEPEMLQLAGQLIEQKSGKFDPSEFKDRYQDALIEMVRAKMKGQEPVVAKAPERGKVVNLMDALRRSLEDGGAQKPPARSRARQEEAPEPAAPARSGAKKKPAKAAKQQPKEQARPARKAS